MSQLRRFFLTLNNYTDAELEAIKEYAKANAKYCVVGLEEAPTTGTKHAHILFAFNTAKRFSTIKGKFPRADIESVKGTLQQAKNYILKDCGTPYFEHGEIPENSKNTSCQFKEMVQQCKDGTVDKECLMYCRYERFFQRFLPPSDYVFNGDLQTKNVWIYGKPRTGKSALVRSFANSRGFKIYNKLGNKWWDGFRDHEVVVLEDLDPSTAKLLSRHFKLWCDRYPFTGEIKGGSLTIDPRFFFIVTSNYSLRDCFEGVDLDAIAPRIYEWNFDT